MRNLVFSSIIIFLISITISSFANIKPENIVGVWLFDEGKGDTVTDSSENGHDGEISGAKWVDGKFGKALEFEGAQFVTVPDAPELQIGEQLTMQAWFFAKDISDWRQIIAKSDEYLLRIDPPQEGNKMSAFVKPGGSWEPRASASVPEKETWIHFAAVYDSDSKGSELKVFVDGVLSGQSLRPGKVAKTVNPVEFGRWGGGSYFVGIIDEVAIFNAALEEADISNTMSNGLGKLISGAAVNAKGKITTTWGNIKSE
jgi:hypothetical protein